MAPGQGRRRGTVGQQVRKEIGEVWTPIWGLGRGDAHMRTFSVVVQKNRVMLTGARPGKRQVAMMVRLERTGGVAVELTGEEVAPDWDPRRSAMGRH
jgi:hypothetical protein